MYASLNDAQTIYPELKEGTTEVWYMQRQTWREIGFDGDLPEKKPLTETHVKLGSIACKDEEKIFDMLQGFHWSPEGEANDLVKGLGCHTSMSVGDIVVIDGVAKRCAACGFKEI